MEHTSHPEAPLIEGGQGRSGRVLEADTVALARLGVAMLVLLLAVVVAAGVTA